MSDIEIPKELEESIRKTGRDIGRFFRPRTTGFNAITELGTLGNDDGVINVPGRGGFVYVTIQHGGFDENGVPTESREVIEVWNPKGFNAPAGHEVRLGYSQEQPNYKQILGMGFDLHGGPDEYRDPSTPDAPPEDYIDRSISKRLIKELNGHLGPGGPFFVEVYREELYNQDNEMVVFETQEIDLAAAVPSDGGERVVVVWVNPDAEEGPELGYTEGEVYEVIGVDGTPITPPPLSEVAPAVEVGYYPVVYVRLFAGQTIIDNKLDIAPATIVFTPVGAGGGFGSRVILTTDEGWLMIGDDGRLLIDG